MKLSLIHGYIDRRILINFVADPDIVRKITPDPFRPKIYKGKAILGICLIRLKNIKPKVLPDFLGISSENGAHRIAVEWDEHGQTEEGVYIPRRDTSLKLNALAGGRIFPGKHYFAKFNVKEKNDNYLLSLSVLTIQAFALMLKRQITLIQIPYLKHWKMHPAFLRKDL